MKSALREDTEQAVFKARNQFNHKTEDYATERINCPLHDKQRQV